MCSSPQVSPSHGNPHPPRSDSAVSAATASPETPSAYATVPADDSPGPNPTRRRPSE